MDQEQVVKAAAILGERVYNNAFFAKLAADWNIIPANPMEQAQLLEIAKYLRLAHETETTKQASQSNPFLTSALEGLAETVAADIGASPQGATVEAVKEAAFNLTQDPEIANAGLTLAQWLLAAEN
ncbi:MAG: hypothetical protein QW463_08010 [Candidatus Caldarchaeum sp.]